MGLIRRLIPKRLFSVYHYLWAFFSALWYGFPSKELVVVGVTGTNGKSSVVWLLTRILDGGGFKVAALSSIEFQVGDEHYENLYKMTMPGRGHIQKWLRRAVEAGCTHAVIEVTSEGAIQHRHKSIDFDVTAFLNLSPEHIERHGGYKNYREAKERLFKSLNIEGIAVVNIADKEAPWFLRHKKQGKTIGFRLESLPNKAVLPKEGILAVAEKINISTRGIRFVFDGQKFSSKLQGTTNIENILVASAIARELGVSLKSAAKTIEGTRDIPGRLEGIPNKKGVRAIVDYAHTPSALERAYQAFRNDARKMICVLGAAGGGRDRWKRPELGKIAGRFCDIVIVTDEDPYDEDPKSIRTAVLEGVKHGGRSSVMDIPDRKDAIREAILKAHSGDAVIVTGKGSEPWMVLARGKKIPWDDREIVRKALDGK